MRPGQMSSFQGSFTYRGKPVPKAELRLYLNEQVATTFRADLAGGFIIPWTFTTRGVYKARVRYVSFPLTVESNEETLVVGYTITIEAGTDGSTTPTPGTYDFQAEDLSVTAQPATDYQLDYWLLDGINAGSANPITIVMDRDHILKAVFKYLPSPPTPPPVGPIAWVTGRVERATGVPPPDGAMACYLYYPGTQTHAGSKECDPDGSFAFAVGYGYDMRYGQMWEPGVTYDAYGRLVHTRPDGVKEAWESGITPVTAPYTGSVYVVLVIDHLAAEYPPP